MRFIYFLCLFFSVCALGQSNVVNNSREQADVKEIIVNKTLKGDWAGQILAGRRSMEVSITFSSESAGEASIPKLDSKKMLLEKLVKNDNKISFECKKGRFEGVMDSTDLSGTFFQKKRKYSFSLKKDMSAEIAAKEEKERVAGISQASRLLEIIKLNLYTVSDRKPLPIEKAVSEVCEYVGIKYFTKRSRKETKNASRKKISPQIFYNKEAHLCLQEILREHKLGYVTTKKGLYLVPARKKKFIERSIVLNEIIKERGEERLKSKESFFRKQRERDKQRKSLQDEQDKKRKIARDKKKEKERRDAKKKKKKKKKKRRNNRQVNDEREY